MQQERLTYLMRRYAEGSLSPSEWDEWHRILSSPDHEDDVKKLLMKFMQDTDIESSDPEKWKPLFDKVFSTENSAKQSELALPAFSFGKWGAAAAAVLVIAVGIYLWPQKKKTPEISKIKSTKIITVQTEVLPGSDKATLTLSSGKTIDLASAGKQTIREGNLSIWNENGRLSYEESDVVVFNTVSTPKGGQYKLILADDTKVWLNAASTITFPTAFTGDNRTVSITGEAYFEVSKNAAKPFIVKAGKEQITVLGTSFNVNAYGDEAVIKTSLLEGSVMQGNKILKPGEAYVDGKVVSANLEKDFAWKNGFFHFENASVRMVMDQMSRWYDVEVVYQISMPDEERFFGKMQRSLNLKDALFILEKSNVHFRLDGRKLIVLSNQTEK